MGDPVPLLLAGSFSPGTAEVGLPGTKEGASWLQALGVDSHGCYWKGLVSEEGLKFLRRNNLTSSFLQLKCYTVFLRGHYRPWAWLTEAREAPPAGD